MDEKAFVHLLETILTPNSNAIMQATQTLQNDCYKNPQSLPLLVQIVRSHDNHDLRQLAAVEARSLVPKFWGVKNNQPSKIPEDVKHQVRESLLHSATQDSSPIVRHSAARVVSAIAKIDLPTGQWQDLPSFLTQAANSAKVGDREVGTYILYTLLETMEEAVADKWRHFLELFNKTINDPESITVRVNTLLALGKMSEVLSQEEYPDAVNAYKVLIPAMVNVLKQIVDSGDEEKANAAFEVFQTLLLVDPAITSSHFRDLVQFFSDLSINKLLDDDMRTKALAFLMSCLRYKKMKVQALRIGETLTLRSMEIVTEFKEHDEDEQTPSRTALALLDYMAASLPPSQVVVPLLNALPNYTNHANPDFRKAGVLALGYCVDGAPDFVVTQLNSIFPVVLGLLNDPEGRVRESALHCVTQLADDLAEELGKEHARLVPILIQMLDSPDGPQTWSRTCNALDAVLTGISQAEVEAYLPTLIPKLSAMFQKDDFKLKAAAVGGIGSTALAAGPSFAPYFQDTMNGLSPYVTFKHSEEELDLRGVVIDCMGSIAEAVGLQAFTPYVEPLMRSAEESLHLGHPRLRETSFMFFATIAKIYGEEFKPFLEGTTRALFSSLDQTETDIDVENEEIASKIVNIGIGGEKANISGNIVGVGGDDDDDDDDDDIWEELSAVNAVALEKEVAAETLGEILSHCRHGFIPYLEKTVKTLAQKAGHPYEGVRKAALGTLWRAYSTLWQVCEENGMQKWQPGLPLKVQPTSELVQLGGLVVGATIDNLKTEGDRGTITDVCQNIAESLKVCGPAVLADADGTAILEVTTQVVLILSKQHPAQLDEDDDEDMPELAESSEYDWMLIDSAMDVLLGMAVALGPQYSDVWKVVESHLLKYASSSEPHERSTSVGVIADSIKYMENAVTPYTEKLLALLLHRLRDENQDTKANAAYAIGLLCYFSEDKQRIVSQYGTIMQRLEPMLRPNPGDNPRVLDNAAGCIARMIMANCDSIPLDEVLPALASILPLKEDYEENEPIYKMLVKLYQSSNQTVFGMTQQFVSIFAQVMGEPEDQLDAKTRAEMVELIKFLASKEPGLIQNFPSLVQLVQ